MIPDVLPLPQRLALAHAGAALRLKLEPFFALDQRLSQFVGQAKEPMLAQMRIAWWRDQLGKPASGRPAGDPVLDGLSAHWSGEETALQCLVDGWEGLLAEPPLPEGAAREFATGRAACFAAAARLSGQADYSGAAFAAGQVWAMADLIARVSDDAERRFLFDKRDIPEQAGRALPYNLRALTILRTLGQRSLNRGGGALLANRRDILTITRLGLFGR